MPRKISAGSYDLNKFLFGGYETDIITTIYGPGGSGKSNLAIIASVSQSKKQNKVIFIDTEGGFSPERFRQIHRGEKDTVEKDLQNILLLKPTSFQEQENSSFSENKTERKVSMVGGDLLKYWSKCLIELKNISGKRTLKLVKHRSLPEKELPFEIIGPGIKKRGLF
jgi:RecA/RadA recombinase